MLAMLNLKLVYNLKKIKKKPNKNTNIFRLNLFETIPIREKSKQTYFENMLSITRAISAQS